MMDDTLVQYMRDWIALNSAQSPDAWDAKAVLRRFLLLPTPKISFDEWVAALDEISRESELEKNEQALSAIKADFPQGK